MSQVTNIPFDYSVGVKQMEEQRSALDQQIQNERLNAIADINLIIERFNITTEELTQ